MPHLPHLVLALARPLLDGGLGTWTSEFPVTGPARTHSSGSSFCGGLATAVAIPGHKGGKMWGNGVCRWNLGTRSLAVWGVRLGEGGDRDEAGQGPHPALNSYSALRGSPSLKPPASLQSTQGHLVGKDLIQTRNPALPFHSRVHNEVVR